MRTLLTFAAVLTLAGCSEVADPVGPIEDTLTLEAPSQTGQDNRARDRPQTWVDGERFRGLVTPATFKPESGNFDELYTGGNGFYDGVPLISESKPGDQDYNGGRWHLNVLKEGVDPDKYADAMGVDDLDLNDFESTDMYFECPLLPFRGNS